MQILITIRDNEFDKSHQEELFTMFKLLCDNICTNGLECKKQKGENKNGL